MWLVIIYNSELITITITNRLSWAEVVQEIPLVFGSLKLMMVSMEQLVKEFEVANYVEQATLAFHNL